MRRRCGRRRRNMRCRRRGRRRRWRNMRWGCGRRRNMGWRCSGRWRWRNMRWRSRGRRRRRSRRRCCSGWWWRGRGSRWGGRRCCLRRLLGLSIRTNLLLGLRHDQRRGLRVRWSSSQLQRGEGCRGKQQESKFCHVVWVPGKFLAKRFGNKICQQTLAINKQALGRIVASFKREPAFISEVAGSESAFVHCAFRRSFPIAALAFSPCGYSRHPGPESGSDAAKSIFPVSVAGEGVIAPCGPRTGNSSGVRRGNSSGCGDSPGSCMGGGTSGRGLPGGLSCAGSEGWPGLIGGSSGGSIGIFALSGISIW